MQGLSNKNPKASAFELISDLGIAISGANHFKFCNMEIRLKRPLVFFDLETTGLSISKDRICQLSMTTFLPHEKGEKPKDPITRTRIINPGVHIPEEASKIHGITDETAGKEPKFSVYAESIAELLEGCDVAGYNIWNYDIPLLREEFLRKGINWPYTDTKVVDVYKLLSLALPRKLSNVYKMFTGIEPENAHDAEYDNMMCITVLEKLIAKNRNYQINPSMALGSPETVDELHDLCKPTEEMVDYAHRIVIDRAGEYVFNFGKHKGEKVTKYPGFCKWMMAQDFTEDTKKCLLTIFGAKNPDQIKSNKNENI